MQDIGTLIDIERMAQPQTDGGATAGQDAPGQQTAPDGLRQDFEPGKYGLKTSERYRELRREFLTKSPNAKPWLIEFERICTAHYFPHFFVLDFFDYSRRNGWKINGEPIANPKGAFYRYARARRGRMTSGGTWNGPNMNDWEFCGVKDNMEL